MKNLLKTFNKQAAQPKPPAERPVREVESTNIVGACSIFYQFKNKIPECQAQIVRLLSAIDTGYEFTANDIESIFFAATNLIETQDPLLLRYALLLFRNLNFPMPFMISNSLRKVMQKSNYFTQGSAIRYFPKIFKNKETGKLYVEVESSLSDFMKSVDSCLSLGQPVFLQSSALMSCVALIDMGCAGLVQKLIPKIKEEPKAKKYTAFHAALLQYNLIRKTAAGDGISLSRLLENLNNNNKGDDQNSLYMHVLIKVALDASNVVKNGNALQYLKRPTNSISPIIQLDAARAILASPYATPQDVSSAVRCLNRLLSSPNRVSVFAALRTISQYAPTRREEFETCNAQLERMLSDRDSSLSAMAAISMLHTGVAKAIDRALPAIKNFAERMPFDQQSSLLKSCVEFTKRCPEKTDQIIDFIWSTFRLQDEKEVQKEFIATLFVFLLDKEENRQKILTHLCEYIEDSKYNDLSIEVINFLAKYGVKSSNRMEIVRALNNRLLLETADVRSASIDALSAFAEGDFPDVGEVRRLIRSFTADVDDEVRDRAVFYTSLYENNFAEVLELTKEKVKVSPPTISSSPQLNNALLQEEKALEEEEDGDDANFGKRLFVSDRVDLIKEGSDIPIFYTVTTYERAVLVKFSVNNPNQDTVYSNIQIELTDSDEQAAQDIEIPEIDEIQFSETKSTSFAITRENADDFPFIVYSGTVRFTMDDEDEQEFPFDRLFAVNFGSYTSKAEFENWSDVAAPLKSKQNTGFQAVLPIKFRNHNEIATFLAEVVGVHEFKHSVSVDKSKDAKTKSRKIQDQLASNFFGTTLVLFEAIFTTKGATTNFMCRTMCADEKIANLCNSMVGNLLNEPLINRQ